MNETIKKLLTKEASRYKVLHEKQIEYDARYLETKYNLETAKDQRQELLNNHELLKADPDKYKETLRIYDKITIPQLKKNLRLAEKKRFENPELSEWKQTVVALFAIRLALTPVLYFSGIVAMFVSIVLVAVVLVAWVKYRSAVVRMSREGV